MKQNTSDLKRYIDQNVHNSRQVWGQVLNAILTNFIDTFQPSHVVASTGARNSIKDKYAGMTVYVRNDNLYVLEDDLTTWSVIRKNLFTNAQITTFLADKVDKVTGKGLSEQDFTTALLAKLNAVENDIMIRNTRIVTDDFYEVDEDEDFAIYVDASDINKEVLLPNAAENIGLILVVKKIDNSANTVRLLPSDFNDSSSNSYSTSNGVFLIEYQFHYTLHERGDKIMIQALEDGNWYKI